MKDRVRVLYVDHDKAVREVVTDVLEGGAAEFEVVTAEDGGAGLAAFDDTIDCVVSDYDLPDYDGIELLRRVRERAPDVPFFLFTGKGSEMVASEAISAGVTDYIQKGSGSQQYTLLANRVANAVEASRSRRELSRRERELATARTRYRTLVRNLPRGAVFLFTEHEDGYRYELAGGEAITDAGFSPETFEGSRLRAVFDEPVAERLADHYRRTLAGERVTFQESWGDHEYRVHTLPIREDGTVVAGMAVSREVTERANRERELEATVDRFRFALEATDSVVWVHDLADDEVVSRYGPIERVLGTEQPPADQETYVEQVVHPDDRERAREAVESLRTGESTSFEIRYRTCAGDRWIADRAEVKSTDDGRRVVGLMQDVTEQTRRERQLERRNDRLEELASVLSHDLRGPLNVAIGELELADAESDRIDRAMDALDRMGELIDDLLTLTRADDEVTERESIDLPATVEACWRTTAYEEASLSVETERMLRADPSQLKQLLENLLSNAVQHGGSDVTVAVGDLPGGFYVADDGPGIPDGERERVTDSGYSTAEDGTGFGLAIVRRIAQAHGWEMTVTEADSGGARFEFTGVECSGT